MKKIFALLAVAAGMLFAAQTASAQLYFGGSVGFVSETLTVPVQGQPNQVFNGSAVKVLPEVGFRINDLIAVGGTIGYSVGDAYFGSLDQNNPLMYNLYTNAMANNLADARNGQRVTNVRVAPYARFFLYNGRRFSLFVEALVGFGSTTTENKNGQGNWDPTLTTKTTNVEILGQPGFAINFDNHFSIIGHLGAVGYEMMKDAQTDRTVSRFGADASTCNLTVGFVYSL
jgi:hypothetical protein